MMVSVAISVIEACGLERGHTTGLDLAFAIRLACVIKCFFSSGVMGSGRFLRGYLYGAGAEVSLDSEFEVR